MATTKGAKRRVPKGDSIPLSTSTPVVISEEVKEKLILKDMLQAVAKCKISKDIKDSELHPYLDKALVEIKAQKPELQDYCTEVFLRNLFYSFSIQRQHNIWGEEGVKSDEIGAQMRAVGRSISRWLIRSMRDWLLKTKDDYYYNLNLLAEYGNYDLLTHNQIRTKTAKGTGKDGSKKNPNKVVSHEVMTIPLSVVATLMAQNYRRGKSKSLIARWLPKYTTGEYRYTTLVAGTDIKRKTFNGSGKPWVSVNGKKYTGEELKAIPLKDGDKIRYPREMKEETKKRIAHDNALVREFCKQMGWDTKQYKEFRHEWMAKTPEHQFSSGKIKRMTKDEFEKWVSSLSSGQQWVVSSQLCFKDKTGTLVTKPNTPWCDTELPKWYVGIANKDAAKAETVRTAMAQGDTSKAKAVAKEMSVKTTGIQTIDLLGEILAGGKTELEINTMHTQLLAKMDMFVPCYVIIDGSGSMTSPIPIGGGRYASQLDIALTLAITFMATNPVEEYRHSCMWFGSETAFTGVTKFANESPNQFVHQARFTRQTEPVKVIDPARTFTENLRTLKGANPGLIASTNAGNVVKTFMSLVKERKLNVEDLPRVLIFITDEQWNTGADAVQADGKGFTQLPQEIGWNPLFVFWGLEHCKFDKYDDAPNTLVLRGFQENYLSQALQFIKKGSINMYDELFAVHEMPGLSLIKY